MSLTNSQESMTFNTTLPALTIPSQIEWQRIKAVHIAKTMLQQPDPLRALLTYRSTPIPGLNLSPARLLMGRELRTTLPTLPQNLRPKTVNSHQLKAADNRWKAKSDSYFNQSMVLDS